MKRYIIGEMNRPIKARRGLGSACMMRGGRPGYETGGVGSGEKMTGCRGMGKGIVWETEKLEKEYLYLYGLQCLKIGEIHYDQV